ncbi:MAG: tripartite tricarboxylate transporter substrate binding protein [Rhodobacter sp.]|nr:tripartite tricarboxylate transporter substrate binding protein [Paracoccaceae bacterium]MCC0081545.1 tripartite tricarboxylate transporter substrate binding protein [Rhodobacter sp.]
MTTIHRRTLLATLGAAGLAATLAPGVSLAQAFPSQPVSIVVPFPAGGGGDFAARMVADKLAVQLGVPVNVINRPGGDGVIGASEVAHATPDGYTLLMATPSPMAYVPAIHRTNPPYDPLTDFRAVSTFASYVFVFAVNSDLPVTDLAGFVDYVHAHPGEVNYGTGDSTSIIAMAQFAQGADLDMVHIPYNGSADAQADLVANRIQGMFLTFDGLSRLGDAVRPLAVLYPERSSLVPDMPTFQELGYAGVDLLPWSGFFTTGGAPDEVVNAMSGALQTVLADPELVSRFEAFGNSVAGSPPEVLNDILVQQLAVWRHMVDVAGIETD